MKNSTLNNGSHGGPVLGLCPIGKFVFSHEDAMRYKQRIQEALEGWGVNYVDLERVIEDGMVRDKSHAERAVKYFQQKSIDGLFMPHCNFGTERAVGIVGRDVEKPVLLWGPRDEAPEPDGTRLRDSLCGLMASSKVLHKLNVPFTYIENCRMDEPAFREGVTDFVRTAHAASALRSGIRVGHIGQRIDFFWSTIIDESALLENFAVEVEPIDMVLFIGDVKDRAEGEGEKYGDEVQELRQEWDIDGLTDGDLTNILAVRDQMLAVAEEKGLDAITIQDFDSLVKEFGCYCLLANSMVSDLLPLAMESDIHGAISNVLVSRVAGGEPAFSTDVTVRHPDDDDGVLLWHCGAPLSMADPECRPELGQHWILPSPVSGMTHFPLRQGPLTVARFDGDGGDYKLAVGEGHSMEGPETQNNYVWMKVDNWTNWERQLMQGPWIHHTSMTYGACADALEEMCRYVPGLEAVRLDT
ncbi:MAG: fucose isomerase [Planctomycetes bacterium]|nr:fucose isomerase [Planctomycetota bacterium]